MVKGGRGRFEIPSSDVEKGNEDSLQYLRFLIGYVLNEGVMDEKQGDAL